MYVRSTTAAAVNNTAIRSGTGVPSAAPAPAARRRGTVWVAQALLALVVVGGLLAILAHSHLPQVPSHHAGHHHGDGHGHAAISHDHDDLAAAIAGRRTMGAGNASEQAVGADDGCDIGADSDSCENFVGSPTLAVDDRGILCHVSAIHDSGCCPTPPHLEAQQRRRRRFSRADRCRFFDVTLWDPPTAAVSPPGNASRRTNDDDLPHEYADVAEELELHDGAYCSAQGRCCSLHELCVSCCMAGGESFVPAATTTTTKPGQFRGCVGRCRHSSANTYHQNQYDSPLHHCYGPRPAAAAGGGRSAKTGQKKGGQ